MNVFLKLRRIKTVFCNSRCSGLEEPIEEDDDLDLRVNTEERKIQFKVKPFQIVSLMLQM